MIGRTIAHYEITGKLGSGGMGEVYAATDTRLGRPVALKFLPESLRSDEEARSRLLREAQAASRLTHPNIVAVHAIESVDGRDVIVMEFVEGQALFELLRQGPLAYDQILSVATQICEGLSRAHRAGVIHRDLKPSNVLIDGDGRVRLVDFGLARALDGNTVTRVGMVLGTPAYMAPEQALGGEMDQRSDVFSFGVLLYEMIAGQLPFVGDQSLAVLYNIVHEDPPSLRTLRPDVAHTLEQIVMRCLAKKPEDRYGNVDAILVELRSIQRGAPSPRIAATLVQPTSKPSIAVLPLIDLSPHRDREYFCDGLAEELITALARIEGLRVVARGSSAAFRGQNLDMRTIGVRLGVENILTGSVRSDRDRLRVTVQLVNVADGSHLWSDRYDRDETDIFLIQEQIAEMVVTALRVRLITSEIPPPAPRPTADLEAYHLYLAGRYHWGKRSREGIARAMELFEQALARDPKFALAYAGIADASILMEDYGMLSFRDPLDQAKAAAQEALALDENLSEAHNSLATVLTEEWDFVGAEREYRRAIELNPGYATAHQWYGTFLMDFGRLDEARAELEAAITLDPLSMVLNADLSRYYYYTRDYAMAIMFAQRALSVESGFTRARRMLYLSYVQTGEYDEAITEIPLWLHEYTGVDTSEDTWRRTYTAGGYDAVQRSLLEIYKGSSSGYSLYYAIGAIHAQLGEADEAFAWLRRAQEARFPNRVGLLADAALDSIRADDRFPQLLDTLNATTLP